jgi:hypothetical protein
MPLASTGSPAFAAFQLAPASVLLKMPLGVLR